MNNGGPAFPGVAYTDMVYVDETGNIKPFPMGSFEGMTLRDYFAAAVLTGCLCDGSGPPIYDAAKVAYKCADAMLVAREETHDSE